MNAFFLERENIRNPFINPASKIKKYSDLCATCFINEKRMELYPGQFNWEFTRGRAA